MELYCIYQIKKGTAAAGEVKDMNLKKINYKEAAVNWIMNEGPADYADILDDIMNCDAFADNTEDEKTAYASRLFIELQRYIYYVIDDSKYDVDVYQFDSLYEAILKADIIWGNLTNRERLNRYLVVAFGTPTREEFENGYLPEEGYNIYHKYQW